MVLCISEAGIAEAAIRSTLSEDGHPTLIASASNDDLFALARGRGAIVYLASPRLLDGWLAPAPDVKRVRTVLGAAQAPGVELVVAVFPSGEGYAAEEEALKI